jgi:ABC-2 type transport system ATP-binding protein
MCSLVRSEFHDQKEQIGLMSQIAADALEITNVRKSFGSIAALEGVSFSLPVGQRLAFLGPNGAGKTTLIRCLSGRTRPDSGTIRLFGRPIDGTGVRQSLGLVPQEIAIYSDLTTRENLTAFGRFYGLRGRPLKDRVEWALTWTGLGDRAADLVGGFSGGMKRRVNLACGVLHQPRVLLLDEPTVGVDPQSRQRIFSMLDELNAEGTTIVLTTHHLEEAEQRCDRIIILDQGKVIADGDIDQLVDRTVGRSRMLRIRVDRPLAGPIELPGPARRCVGRRGDRVIKTRIDDVSDELPLVLDSTRRSGYEVADVEVHSPSLHHVFLHLTGFELRD